MAEKLDEKWFERIKRFNAQVPTRLKPTNYFEARDDFFRGAKASPDFVYGNLEDYNAQTNIVGLQKLSDDISQCTTTDPVVKDLYQKKITEKIAQFNLVNCVQLIQTRQSVAEHVHNFKEHTEHVYGKPSHDIFNHLLMTLHGRFDTMTGPATRTLSFRHMRALCDGDFATSVEPFPGLQIPSGQYSDSVTTSASELRKVFETALKLRGLLDWKVEINPDRLSQVMVWPRSKKISIPNDTVLANRIGTKQLTDRRVAGLVAHEVDTHIMRVENALRSPLLLLSIGLDHYWRGEEGLAKCHEQSVVGGDDYASPNVYLAIGLAYGLDRSAQARNFREVFELMRDYYSIIHNENDHDFDKMAFRTCAHVFKGASSEAPSLLLTRDIAYREGNIAIWHLLNRIDGFQPWLNAGKFDPTNNSHTSALQHLGIIPSFEEA